MHSPAMDKTHSAMTFEQFLSCVVTDNSVIDKINSYMHYWEKEIVQLDIRCSVCDYILNHKRDQNLVIKLHQLNSIGKQMPENVTGILLVWLYIQYEFTIEERQAKFIDPLSILIHVIIGCCENDQDATINMGHLMKETIVNTMKIHSEKDTAGEIYQQFKEFIRQLGTCDGHKCLYADTGGVKLVLESRLLPDARAYISEDWISNNTSHSFVRYHNEKHYVTAQPGIDYHHNINGQKSPSVNSPTDDPKMFLTTANMEPLETKELLCMTTKKIEQKRHDFIRDTKFILSVCSCVDSISCENDCIFSLINASFPVCIWCSLCVIPGMRAIMNDLAIMAKKILTSCGIGSDVQQHSPLIINHQLYNRKRKQKPPINSKYSDQMSFNFDRCFLTKQAINHAFVEWKTEKFPILQHICSDIDINSLWNHVSLMGDVYCKKNIKRTYIHTDLHQEQNTHTCPVTHAICILNILVNSKIKVQKEISKMQIMAIAHNLYISNKHTSNNE